MKKLLFSLLFVLSTVAHSNNQIATSVVQSEQKDAFGADILHILPFGKTFGLGFTYLENFNAKSAWGGHVSFLRTRTYANTPTEFSFNLGTIGAEYRYNYHQTNTSNFYASLSANIYWINMATADSVSDNRSAEASQYVPALAPKLGWMSKRETYFSDIAVEYGVFGTSYSYNYDPVTRKANMELGGHSYGANFSCTVGRVF